LMQLAAWSSALEATGDQGERLSPGSGDFADHSLADR
jgi:hypothetical protein